MLLDFGFRSSEPVGTSTFISIKSQVMQRFLVLALPLEDTL